MAIGSNLPACASVAAEGTLPSLVVGHRPSIAMAFAAEDILPFIAAGGSLVVACASIVAARDSLAAEDIRPSTTVMGTLVAASLAAASAIGDNPSTAAGAFVAKDIPFAAVDSLAAAWRHHPSFAVAGDSLVVA